MTDTCVAATKKNNRCILVVDSELNRLLHLSDILGKFEYRFETGTSAAEALELAKRIQPMLIIYSADADRMESVVFVRQIKLNPLTSSIPVICLMAEKTTSAATTLLVQNGAICMSRPLDIEFLYVTIQKTVETNPRSCLRVKLTNPIKAVGQPEENFKEARIVSMSAKGMYLQNGYFTPGTLLVLQFGISDRNIEVEAVVLYRRKNEQGIPGMGLAFTKISDNDVRFIKRLILDEIKSGVQPKHQAQMVMVGKNQEQVPISAF